MLASDFTGGVRTLERCATLRRWDGSGSVGGGEKEGSR
jgi:hypothetical protein